MPGNKVGVSVEYVYRADIGRSDQRNGYGISHFLPDDGNELVCRSGYYLAGEEDPPYRCEYKLQRLDSAFLQRIGARIKSLKREHLIELVPSIETRYGQVSTGSDFRSKKQSEGRRNPNRLRARDR